MVKRLNAIEKLGRCVTLRLKTRREGAGEPAKFLGHGICDSRTRSRQLSVATSDPHVVRS